MTIIPKVNVSYLQKSSIWLSVLLFCAVLLFASSIFKLEDLKFSWKLPSSDQFQDNSLKTYIINTPGCRIPYMNPFDPSIIKYIYRVKAPICNRGKPALVDSNLTSIYIVDSALKFYNLTDESYKCCHQAFWREMPKTSDKRDDKVKFASNCIGFEKSAKIVEEFIKVTCSKENIIVYKDYFSFVPIKVNQSGSGASTNKMNVLIIGLDALSRLNFHRQMPKFTNFLIRNLSAIEFFGYNKVADNTFPNLLPVLTGLNQSEVQGGCWKNRDRFDECRFIWDYFKKSGYVTSFGEEAATKGLFNLGRKGFYKQPTDYMWGVMSVTSERSIGNIMSQSFYKCVGAREVYKTFFQYINNFVTTLSLAETPYFAILWSCSLTHHFFNQPYLADGYFENFFNNFKVKEYLKNTVLIVMSDHGMRFGKFRATYQGMMEERLPGLFISFPPKFKKNHNLAYRNLIKNTKRLTTHFDLHETLKNLANPSEIDLVATSQKNKKSRGYSLFSEISPNRTCDDAGFSSHWCTCLQVVDIDVAEPVVLEASNFAVYYINRLLANYTQCAILKLDGVKNARIKTHTASVLRANNLVDYMITFQTLPGIGLFEVTVRSIKIFEEYHFTVIGTISRLNMYGEQSSCIPDVNLKLYCYCNIYL